MQRFVEYTIGVYSDSAYTEKSYFIYTKHTYIYLSVSVLTQTSQSLLMKLVTHTCK